MKKLILMAIFFALNASAQQITWQKYITTSPIYNSCLSLVQLPDSGFLISGTNPQPYPNGQIFRTDKYGDTLWLKKIDTWCNLVRTNDDGFAYAGGSTLGLAQLTKLDTNGDSIWTVFYPQYISLSVTACHDGGFILSSNNSFFKTDSLGAVLWTEYTGGHLFNILECNNGDILAMGFTGVCPGNYGLKLVDSLGNFKWSKTYGNVPQSFCQGVSYGVEDAVELPDSNFMVICDAFHYLTFSPNVNGYDLMKINRQTGDTIKTIIFDSLFTTQEYADIVYAKDSSLFMTFQGVMIKSDIEGEKLWRKSSTFNAYDLISCSDGGFAIAGNYYSGIYPNLLCNSTYAKLDSLGNIFNFQGIASIAVNALRVYPNPAINQLAISSQQLANGQEVTVTIFDMLGKVQLQQTIFPQGDFNVDVNGLPSGIYLLQLKQEDRLFNGRFVKE